MGKLIKRDDTLPNISGRDQQEAVLQGKERGYKDDGVLLFRGSDPADP